MQICWGSYSRSSIKDFSDLVITFEQPFKNDSIPSFVANAGKNDGNKGYRSATTNYFSISNTMVKTGWYGDGSTMLTWVAIGYWK